MFKVKQQTDRNIRENKGISFYEIPSVSRSPATNSQTFFDVLLTVHLSIFISVFNQLDAQILFHNKFYFMPLHVSSTCAHRPPIGVMIPEAV